MQVRKSAVVIYFTILASLLFFLSINSQSFAAPRESERGLVSPPLVSTPAPPSPGAQGPVMGRSASPASFDGDVRQLAQPRSATRKNPAPQPLWRNAPSNSSAPAQPPAANSKPGNTPGMAAALTPEQNFIGLDFANWGSGWPPDPNGDVGPNHYLQAVNTSIGIFSKTGARQVALTFDDLFSSGPYPCNLYNQGDPIVLYDAPSGRWIVADFAWYNIDNEPYYECIAVSKTGGPVAGGWWLYAFQTDSDWMGDYPKLGVWADGIYMSANMWDIYNNGYGGTPMGVRVWAFNRDDLINGLPFRNVAFNLLSPPDYSTLLPSNLRGNSPPYGSPNYFASIDQPSTFHLWKFHVDWSNLGNSTFTGPADLAVPSFAMPCYAANVLSCVPQLSGELVDGLGDRLMMQLQYRYIDGVESLWANHTVAANQSVGTATGIRWYEIRNPNGTPTIFQSGTFQPDSDYRWMGSLAVDQDGNMALGYSVSSASMHPAIRYTGRLASDPLGVLQTETTMISGGGSQSGGYSRWGDYSAMTVDPVDKCTFWYTNEYYATTGNDWQTRIGSFRFPQCGTVTHWSKYYFPFLIR